MSDTAISPFEEVAPDFEYRSDSALVNTIIGLGKIQAGDKLAATDVAIDAPRLSWKQKEALFDTDSFCRAVCEVIPNKAVSGGWEITLGGSHKDSDRILNELRQYERNLASTEDSLDAELDEDEITSIADLFRTAQVWANVKDGACIVLNIDDGQPPYNPVRANKIRSIVSADVMDRTQIRPVFEQHWNPMRPTHYEILLPDQLEGDRLAGMFENSDGDPAYFVHRSRIIRFDGIKSTASRMQANGGWGGSPIDLLWNELNRWRVTQDAIANAVVDFSLFIHSMKDFRNLMSKKDAQARAAIEKRIEFTHIMKSVLGGITIDADGEKLEYLTRQFGGVSELIKEFRDTLIGASRLPHTLLFGESPSGLGATGESEENSIANLVREFEINVWEAKLRRMYRLIFLAKDGPTKGKEPEGWGIKFIPLIPESEGDQVQTRSTQSQTDNAYIQSGVLLPEEVRTSRFGGDKYSIEVTLDEKLWKKKQEEANADPFADFGGGEDAGGGEQPALPPGEEQPFDPAEGAPGLEDAGEAKIDSADYDDRIAFDRAMQETRQRFRLANSSYAIDWMNNRYRQLRRSA